MNTSHRCSIHIFRMALCALILFSFGCAHDVRKPAASLDSPEHHVFSGLKLLENGRVDDAQREFNLALELDPKYSQAHYGLGLTLGHKEDFEPAFKAMTRAKKFSKVKMEKAVAYVGVTRLHLLQKNKNWLKDVEENFRKALSVIKDLPEAHYYMGVAYKEAYRFNMAQIEFKQVLDANQTHVLDADRQLKLVQRVERAMPGTEVGKKLALQEKITRADAAAVFVHELNLDKIYGREKKGLSNEKALPADIMNHSLKADIETIIRIGLRGLEVTPDGNFYPDNFISRAEYAMMVEDIISTITRDKDLGVKYIGYPSPFPDLRSDTPYFNAVVVCTTRGIMEAEDIMTGQFNPEGHISGADALLVIRKLREKQ